MKLEDLSYKNKYRPDNFDDVIGQEAIIKSLKGLFKSKKCFPHIFMFSGNSGTGKTTLARIIAKELGCENNNIIEIDAATHSGKDDLKAICTGLQYSSLGKNPIKFVIMDECHAIGSAKGWDSMLKILEEPPDHVYFVFLTTELNKVPKAIKTRCESYSLKDVSSREIAGLLDYVVKEENLKLDNSIVDLIARESGGSPRMALNYLSKCRDCSTTKEVSELLETFENEDDLGELFKMLSGGGSWTKALEVVRNLDIADYEGVRIPIFNYLTKCVLNSKTEKDSIRFLDKLDKFSKPYYIQQTSKGEFLLSLADILCE